MKNATKYAEKTRSLLRSLLKEHKPEPMVSMDPLKALVRAAMLYDVPDTRADEAMRHIEREFVDLNELRVATELEVQELLGTRYPEIEQRVMIITRCLNAIFEKEHTLSLDRLQEASRKDLRQFLHELLEITPFVEGYVVLMAFRGQAVPLDERMLDYLIEEQALPPEVSIEDAQKFLEHHLKLEECYDFYVAVRRAAYDEGGKARKKARA